MPVELSDTEIKALVAEKKPLPDDYREKLRKLRPKRGHKECILNVEGVSGSKFRVIIRKNNIDALNFSVILAYLLPEKDKIFRLRRYNGKHQHTNVIEKQTFYDFHIHMATERYQEIGADEEAFAVTSSEYHNAESAVECLFNDCGFERPLSERRQVSLDL